MRISTGIVSLSLLWASVSLPAAASSPFTAADLLLERQVAEPAISPDGQWVAYVSGVADIRKDAYNSDLWMASWDGKQNIRLTRTAQDESSPRWSPDGRYLAFLAARPATDGDTKAEPVKQVWLLDRSGGEPEQLTSFKGSVAEFDWSPDGRRLAVIARDEESRKTSDPDATPPPIVLDRYYFKEDYTGYVGPERKRLFIFDMVSRKATRITASTYDESRPAWSPDGSELAFLGREGADPDRGSRYTLFIARPGSNAAPRRLVEFQGDDSSWMATPQWSPDGKRIAYVAGGDPKLIYYAVHGVHVIAAAGGVPRAIAAKLDRNTTQPRWAADGKRIYFLLEDDRNQQLVNVTPGDERVRPVTAGRREVADYALGRNDQIALLESTVDRPAEILALERSTLRPLSKQNDDWLSTRQLASTEEISVTSRDGTRISGFIVKPPNWQATRRYPAILRIHGGPVSQYANTFMADWQVLAAAGYVVIAANPRGSSGRGEAFSTAIYADWGNKDSEDVLAAVDYAVRQGIADPDRLGVGGWSYGGILTNQVIARDGRFKAATSGASLSNALAGYGTDMYIREYEAELGRPWENPEAYVRVSYPFFNAGRINTPTLFLCGDKDFNVPLLNSEQMYQALKSRGVDTRLVIYPDQFHGLEVPSYITDRMQRYLDWYDKYLK